jgi:hypothetical protein
MTFIQDPILLQKMKKNRLKYNYLHLQGSASYLKDKT